MRIARPPDWAIYVVVVAGLTGAAILFQATRRAPASNSDSIGFALAFHPGFPHGRPGEVASRLLRRETLVLPHRSEPVLAWTEIDRRPFIWRNLAGLSGAPALNADGQVIGVTVAQAPRLRRIYTTTPGALRAALAAAGVRGAEVAGNPLSLAGYAAGSDNMRGALRVAQVVCLDR